MGATLQTGRFHAVMHFAAFIEAGESMRDPGKYFRNNLASSLGLLESCARAGVQRFVLSSSAAVYASSDDPLTEEHPLGPANVYGQTKLMIEQALEWYHRVHGLRFAALRYFNAAGALAGSRRSPPAREPPDPAACCRWPWGSASRSQIFGTDYPTPDGTCIRDYIHIADLVSAHLLALEALEDRDRLIYNLGNGDGYSVRQVIDAARQVTGHPLPAVEAPAARATHPAWWPAPRRSAASWAGSRSTPRWRKSSPAPGSGIAHTPAAMAPDSPRRRA